MKISDFDYELPVEKIAKFPPKVRGTSNLLVLDRKTCQIEDRKYSDLVDYLKPGDVLVLNNTKVIKARLLTERTDGAKREIVLLEKHSDENNNYRHKVMYRGKLSVGDELIVGKAKITVDEIIGDGIAVVRSDTDLIKLAEKYGLPPLPPYIKREATKEDIKRYQTVFAKTAGSVAAPTASLNMTDELLKKIVRKGVKVKYLTLHVGLGTFMPIRENEVEKHQMHSEYFEIPDDTIKAIKNARRVVAVGTTVARTLEYAIPENLRSGEADIFIYPGYEFKVIDALITNFHAPRSTVLMLTSAFAGWDNLRNAYEHAKTHGYKFLSYGDSMLIVGDKE